MREFAHQNSFVGKQGLKPLVANKLILRFLISLRFLTSVKVASLLSFEERQKTAESSNPLSWSLRSLRSLRCLRCLSSYINKPNQKLETTSVCCVCTVQTDQTVDYQASMPTIFPLYLFALYLMFLICANFCQAFD